MRVYTKLVVLSVLLAASCAKNTSSVIKDTPEFNLRKGVYLDKVAMKVSLEQVKILVEEYKDQVTAFKMLSYHFSLGRDWQETVIKAWLIDLNRDGQNELILTYMSDGEKLERLSTILQFESNRWVSGVTVSDPEGFSWIVVDFNEDGLWDLVNQGGRSWLCTVIQTFPSEFSVAANVVGGLDDNILTVYRTCGYSYGKYCGYEGLGRVQKSIPYKYSWDKDIGAFTLNKSHCDSVLIEALLVCFQKRSEEVEDNRYIDYWNWAVCLFVARLEYDKAFALAKQIPSSPNGDRGKIMSKKDKESLIEQIKEYEKEHQSGTRLKFN